MVDEIGSSEEVRACRKIAQRGVIIVAAAQATSLKGLIGNAELNALVGGVHEVNMRYIQATRITLHLHEHILGFLSYYTTMRDKPAAWSVHAVLI